MYGLSKNVDLSFLRGAELQQVCIGRNELILNFDRDVRITILSSLGVSCPRGVYSTNHSDVVVGGIKIVGLLNDVILDAEATDEGDLMMTFESGWAITAIDDSDEYESFWIAHGAEQIIV